MPGLPCSLMKITCFYSPGKPRKTSNDVVVNFRTDGGKNAIILPRGISALMTDKFEGKKIKNLKGKKEFLSNFLAREADCLSCLEAHMKIVGKVKKSKLFASRQAIFKMHLEFGTLSI